MTGRFLFAFHDHDIEDDPEVVYTFTMTGPPSAFEKTESLHDDYVLEFTEEMEEYGIHDFGTCGETLGYHSGEIKADKRDEVIQKWREFIPTLGFTIGETEIMSFDEYNAKFPQYGWAAYSTPAS